MSLCFFDHLDKPAGTDRAPSTRACARVCLLTAALAGLVLVPYPVSPASAQELLPSATQGNFESEADQLASDSLRLVEQGLLAEASGKINAALKIRSDRSYFHLINGLIYHLQARKGTHASFELADQGYRLAIQFDRSNWLANFFAGQLALDRGKFDSARAYFAEALLFRSDDPELLKAFSYAAYRSGEPDLAAGAVDTLEKKGMLDTTDSVRNAAMVMAAVGQTEKAQLYLERLKAMETDKGGVPVQSQSIARRLDDWSGFYKNQGAMVKTQFGAPAVGGMGGVGGFGMGFGFGMPPAPGSAVPGAAALPSAPGTANNMVVVDVVMIATEENYTTAKGVNLLSNLAIQFGGGYQPGAAFNRSTVLDKDPNVLENTTLVRSMSIPAVTYSLNIANSNNQRNEILARPTLVATAGRTSEFFYGTELNAAVGSSSTTVAPISIQKEIGVKLTVTPVYIEDGRVSLLVSAQRSFIKAPSPDNTFTMKLETSKSQVSANVVMNYGESLVLGGLSEKEVGNTRDGVPLLQDIPGIQYLFSRQTTTDIQKSVLILITPRPPQYVYQTEKAREAYEKSLAEEDRPIASLRARYADWFKPYPNWASIFHHMQDNSLYREFRTGDVSLESWSDMRSLKDRLRLVRDFLHY